MIIQKYLSCDDITTDCFSLFKLCSNRVDELYSIVIILSRTICKYYVCHYLFYNNGFSDGGSVRTH